MDSEEIDVKELLSVLWNKKGVIVLVTLITAIIGGVYSFFLITPKYSSTIQLLLAQGDETSTTPVTTSTNENQGITQAQVQINEKLVGTYKEIAKSDGTLSEVIRNLGLNNVKESDLKKEVEVEAVEDTQIINVTITDENPRTAMQIANELGRVLSEKIKDYYKTDNVVIMQQAVESSTPSNINHKKDILIFMIGGFVLSIVVIVVISLLDDKIKSGDEIESSTDMVILAKIPLIRENME